MVEPYFLNYTYSLNRIYLERDTHKREDREGESMAMI
jgi:hypothetical protein